MQLNPDQARRLCDAALSSDADPPFLGVAGDSFGGYRITRMVGRGGMGEVYEAEQDRTGRRVAVKVVRPEMLSADLARRFEYEVRVLARLQHPGIAQVFEAGRVETPAGSTPYFAMEYVEGKPLTAYAKEKNLPLRERLGLFLKVCDAVEHAHRMGVIHRDLKPENILVDASGQPRILDFGVARATDADVQTTTMHTEVGRVLGTLPYMSPEQVVGDPDALDTRSDVYSLGVVLYELLAGKLPYVISRAQMHEAARVIKEEEPTRLGTIDRVYRGDLETIAGKALEKEKGRRYQGVGEFAQDLRSHLNDEPISAKPPSTWAQASRFARKNRGLAFGVAAAFVIAIVGAVVTTGFALEANRQRDIAILKSKEADRKSAVAWAVTDFLQSTLQSAAPGAAGRDAKVVDVVRVAAGLLDSGVDQPAEVQGAVYHAAGATLYALGDYPASAKALRRAYELRNESLGARDSDTLKSLQDLATAEALSGNWPMALELATKALETRRAVFGGSDRATIQSMVMVADMLERLGRREESQSLIAAAVESSKALGEQDQVALRARFVYGKQLAARGRDAEATQTFEDVLRLRRKALGNAHPDTLEAMWVLAGEYTKKGDFAAAESLLAEAIPLLERVNGEHNTDTLDARETLAGALAGQRKFREAVSEYRKVVEAKSAVFGPNSRTTLGAMNGLAVALGDLGEKDEAANILQQVLETGEATLGPNHPDVGVGLINLGRARQAQGRSFEAEELFRRALGIWKQSNPNHWVVGLLECMIGKSMQDQKKFEEAEKIMLEGHSLLAEKLGEGHLREQDAVHNLVDLYTAWGKTDQAEEWKTKLKASDGPGK